MKRLVFTFDAERCSGCMACVVACQDQHDLAPEIALRRVTYRERGPYPARVDWRSSACRHCVPAPCLEVCPAGAITRHAETGAVIVAAPVCTGCRSCTTACPFGVPQYTADGTMLKCDGCHLRIEHGLLPACVHTCTTGALGVEVR